MGTDDTHDPSAPPTEAPAASAGDGVAKAPDEGASERARDLLKTDRLHRRARLGERLLQRVGGRMWDRPNLAVSARLYKRFQLDDPWAPPGTAKRGRGVGLGPVSLRFGEKRRQPAPHLRPKEPKKKKQLQAADPVAKYRRPKPTPKPAEAKPPTPKPPAPKPTAQKPPGPPGPTGKYAITGSSGEFGRNEKKGLVGKLPVRPDLAQGGDKKSAPKRPAPTRSRAPTPPPRPASPPKPTGPKNSSRPPARTRRQPNSAGGGGGGGAGVPLPRPKLPTPKKRRAGRFRMSPTEVRSPVVKKIVAPEPVVRQTEAAATAPEPAPKKKKKVDKPIDRSIPTGPMGLDDLFGAMDGGRMRVGRRKKKKEDDEET